MTTTVDDLVLSAADVEIQASGKAPAVSIVAYTGGLMSVPGWGPIAIDLAGIDASAEQVGILADHDATLKGIVGHGRAVVANGKLLVQGTITPSTDAARQVIDLARGGFRFQASVGVTPVDYDRVRAGERIEVNGRAIKAPASGFTLVRAGVLREVSIVALAADRGTSVAITAHEMEQDMPETETVSAEQIRAEALAETNRINAIRKACGGRFGDIETPDLGAIENAWEARQQARDAARLLVRSSDLFSIPHLLGKQIVYRTDHEIAASRSRGRCQALELAKETWFRLRDARLSDEQIRDSVIKPWGIKTEAWTKAEIDPQRISPPPRPEQFISESQQRMLEPKPKVAANSPDKPLAITRRLTNVQRELLDWLWPGRIPLGKLTLLAGDPGLGKSFVTLDIAARVSRGDAWSKQNEPPWC